MLSSISLCPTISEKEERSSFCHFFSFVGRNGGGSSKEQLDSENPDYFDSLRPSQQSFSYSGVEPVLIKDKCVLLKDTTQ